MAVAVAVSVTRQSTGSASRSNLTANDVCVPVTESLDGGPDCGGAQRDRANLSMTFEGAPFVSGCPGWGR